MPDIGAFFTATLKRQIVPDISDTILKENCWLRFLNEKKALHFGKGGDGGQFRVRKTASAIGGASSDWGTQNLQTTQPFDTATFAYKQYRWPLVVSGFQKRRNENAGPEAKMFDMWMEQVAEVRQAAIERIGRHIYTGSGTDYTGDLSGQQIDGAEQIIDNDNTYLGFARASNSWWQAQLLTCGDGTTAGGAMADPTAEGNTLLLQKMNQMWVTCSQGGKQTGKGMMDKLAQQKDVPDYIITTPTGFQYYQRSLQSQQRYVDPKADAAKQLAYQGYALEWDTFVPTGTVLGLADADTQVMYFLNSKWIDFDCVGDSLLEVLDEQKIINPWSYVYLIGGQYQQYSRNPSRLGRLLFA
jgi:hypothetical protein